MIQVIQTKSGRLSIPIQHRFWLAWSGVLMESKEVLPIDLVAARDVASDGRRGGR